MILTLKELAEHLKVNERTILRMLQSGQITGAKIGGQWRFNSTQVDQMFFPEHPGPDHLPAADLLPKHRINPISRIVRESRILLDLQSTSAQDVLEELCRPVINEALLPDAKTLRDRVKAREEMLSTGVGRGVAIPHPRDPIPTLCEPSILVYGRSEKGVDFSAADGKTVHHFFLLCAQTVQTHLVVMGRLAEVLQKPDILDDLWTAENADDVERAVLKAERKDFFEQ